MEAGSSRTGATALAAGRAGGGQQPSKRLARSKAACFECHKAKQCVSTSFPSPCLDAEVDCLTCTVGAVEEDCTDSLHLPVDAATVLQVPATAVQRTQPSFSVPPPRSSHSHDLAHLSRSRSWGIDCTFPSAAGPVVSAKSSQGRSATPPTRAAKVSAATAIASAAVAAPPPPPPAAPEVVVASATPDVAEQLASFPSTFFSSLPLTQFLPADSAS